MSVLTPETLIEHGYRRYGREACHLTRADELFQKKIGGNYFINIFRYRYEDRDGWQPEVQFNTDAEQLPAFNVTLIGETSLEAVETFFARMYERMECQPNDEEAQPQEAKKP